MEIVRRLMAMGEEVRANGVTSVPTDIVSPDAEIDLSHRVFNPDTYRGVEGLMALNEQLREVWAEWHVTPERLIDAGDKVVSIEFAKGRGRGSGIEAEGRYASIWTFEDGRVTRIEVGLDPDEALKSLGLDE